MPREPQESLPLFGADVEVEVDTDADLDDIAPGNVVEVTHDRRHASDALAFNDADLESEDEDDVLYLLDFEQVKAKDATIQLEHPFYTLSTRVLDQRVLTYEHRDTQITVEAGPNGLPTIHDKDVLIYLLSQAMRMRRENGIAPKKMRVRMVQLLEFTRRGSSGKSYINMQRAIRRLVGTTIRTNARTGGQIIDESFHLIDSVRIVRYDDDPDRRMAYIEVRLGDWLHNAIKHDEVLTLSRDYLALRKPLDRRIYEIGRKHCGHQPEWSISLALLHKKSGSQGPAAKLKRRLLELEKEDSLPDYRVEVVSRFDSQGRDDSLVKYISKAPQRHRKSRRTALPGTIETIARALKVPHYEVYTIEDEFREHAQNTRLRITSYDAQFVEYAISRSRAALLRPAARRRKTTS